MLSPIKQSLISGFETASGSRSSATYYHNKDEQMKAIHIALIEGQKVMF